MAIVKLPTPSISNTPKETAIHQMMIENKYNKNTNIILEPQTDDTVYMIMNGIVKLTESDSMGNQLTVHYLYPGNMFGEFNTYEYDSTIRTIEAVTDCRIGSILRSEWLRENEEEKSNNKHNQFNTIRLFIKKNKQNVDKAKPFAKALALVSLILNF